MLGAVHHRLQVALLQLVRHQVVELLFRPETVFLQQHARHAVSHVCEGLSREGVVEVALGLGGGLEELLEGQAERLGFLLLLLSGLGLNPPDHRLLLRALEQVRVQPLDLRLLAARFLRRSIHGRTRLCLSRRVDHRDFLLAGSVRLPQRWSLEGPARVLRGSRVEGVVGEVRAGGGPADSRRESLREGGLVRGFSGPRVFVRVAGLDWDDGPRGLLGVRRGGVSVRGEEDAGPAPLLDVHRAGRGSGLQESGLCGVGLQS